MTLIFFSDPRILCNEKKLRVMRIGLVKMDSLDEDVFIKVTFVISTSDVRLQVFASPGHTH
jgi:hypothetical protein